MPDGQRRDRGSILAGAVSVGTGVLASGAFTYIFLSLTGRVLGARGFAPISTLWSLVFIVGPGLFMPLQQEIGRVIATRRAERSGRHALRQAVVIAAAQAAGCALIALAASSWLTHHLFHGNWALFWCLEISIVSYAATFLVRGVFSGLGDFRQFTGLVAAESFARLVIAGVIAAAGVRSAGYYGAAIAVAPIVSTVVVSRMGRRLRLAAEPPAGWRDLTKALGWLVIGSLLGQFVANAGPVAVQLLATHSEQAQAGRFLSALVIARVSLYLFQAIQATLLPNLSEMVGRGRIVELRQAMTKLVVIIVALAAVGTVAAFFLGPFAVRVLFGSGFEIGNLAMAMLTCASTVYVLAAALSGAAIAAGAHYLSALAWAIGTAAFLAGMFTAHDLFLRVEIGYLAGAAAATLTLFAGIARVARTALPAPAAPMPAAQAGVPPVEA